MRQRDTLRHLYCPLLMSICQLQLPDLRLSILISFIVLGGSDRGQRLEQRDWNSITV